MQVEAETLADNEISCRLLESMGFKSHGEYVHFLMMEK